jgi:glycerophosphoryl diester phosphodiesterase
MRIFSGLPWPLGPVAHRGLHDARHGIIENTASAFRAAIAAGYAIETDVQAAVGDEPVVFHDETLERLTHATGSVAALTPEALKAIAFKESQDRILSLAEFLDLVRGRVPVYVEVKTVGDNAARLVHKVTAVLAAYNGPLAMMSFDPRAVTAMRSLAPRLPRGLVSMRFTKEEAPELSPLARFRLTHMLDFPAARPNFLAYHVGDLPRPGVALLRRLGLPILAWTVRSEDQRRRAMTYADGIIFEELRP